MQERLQQLINILKKWIDRVVLAMLILIACGLFYLGVTENLGDITSPAPSQPYEVPDLFPNPEYDRAISYMKTNDNILESHEGHFKLVTEFNPFDKVLMRNREQIEREITRKMQRARRLYEEKNYQECIEVCEAILKMEIRQEALKLIESCKKALAGEEKS